MALRSHGFCLSYPAKVSEGEEKKKKTFLPNETVSILAPGRLRSNTGVGACTRVSVCGNTRLGRGWETVRFLKLSFPLLPLQPLMPEQSQATSGKGKESVHMLNSKSVFAP